MVHIKRFLESEEYNDSVNEIKDFFVYSDLDDEYDMDFEEFNVKGWYDVIESGEVENIAKINIINTNSKGIRDVIDDIKPVVARMEEISDYSISTIIFIKYGLYTDYKNIREENPDPKFLDHITSRGRISQLINTNDDTEKRIILYIYRKVYKQHRLST